jgi:hypothetical protein
MGGARVSWRAPPTRVSPRDRRRPRLLSELSELESFSSVFQSKRAQPSGPRRGPSELWRGHFGRAGFSPMRLVLAEFVSHSWQNSRAVLGTGASSGARASSSASAGTSY